MQHVTNSNDAAALAQVPDPEQQHRVMIEAVENHMPEAIIIDEIGEDGAMSKCHTTIQCSVLVAASAAVLHPNKLLGGHRN